MNKTLATLLQAVIVLFGIVVLGLMLWEPHLEGRNAHATVYQIYFNDPFLAYAYGSSIAFFAGLYQAFVLAGLAGQKQLYSSQAVRSAQIIKRCAMLLAGLIALPLLSLLIIRPEDDIAGGVALGLFLIIGSFSAAAVSSVIEKRVQKGMESVTEGGGEGISI